MYENIFDFKQTLPVINCSLLELNQDMVEQENEIEKELMLVNGALKRINQFESTLDSYKEIGLESNREIKLFNLQLNDFCSEFGLDSKSFALESVSSSEVGLEGIKETLSKLKKKIQSKLKEIGLKIKNYTKEQSRLVPTIQAEVYKRQKKLKESEINETVKFSSGKYLTTDGKAMTIDEIVNGLAQMSAYHQTYGKAVKVNIKRMTSIVKEMQTYLLKTLDREDVLSTLNNINTLLDEWIPEYTSVMSKHLTNSRSQIATWLRVRWDNSAEGVKTDTITYMTEAKPSFNIDNPAIVVNSEKTKIGRAYYPQAKVKKKDLTFTVDSSLVETLLKSLDSTIVTYGKEIDNNDLELVETRLSEAYMRTATVTEHGFGFANGDASLTKVLNRVYFTTNATCFEVALAELKRVRIISNAILTLVDRAIK